MEGRTADDAAYWLAQAAPAWRDAIRVVAIDMCSIYASAVRRVLPGARIAVDLFHVVHLAVKMTGDVRRRVVRGKYGRRGRSGDPEYGIKNLLVRNLEHLSPAQFTKIMDTLQADPAGQEIAAAWIGKEKLRDVLNLRARVTGSTPCERDVRGPLFAFYDWCAQNDDIPELVSLAQTVARWEGEIVCAVLTGVTNAASESLNRLAKLEARLAYGFRNPANQRRRVRIACTRGRRRKSRTATSKRPRSGNRTKTPSRLTSKSRKRQAHRWQAAPFCIYSRRKYGPGMDTSECWALVAAQRRDLADAVADLPGTTWDTPSLRAGWRVRDVVAHLVGNAEGAFTARRALPGLLAHRLNVEAWLYDDGRRRGAASPRPAARVGREHLPAAGPQACRCAGRRDHPQPGHLRPPRDRSARGRRGRPGGAGHQRAAGPAAAHRQAGGRVAAARQRPGLAVGPGRGGDRHGRGAADDPDRPGSLRLAALRSRRGPLGRAPLDRRTPIQRR